MRNVLTEDLDNTHNVGNTTRLEGSSGNRSGAMQCVSKVSIIEAASLLIALSAIIR